MATRGGEAGGGGNRKYECTRTIGGHAGRVFRVLLGKGLVLTGSEDSTIRVLDADTFELLYVLEGHQSYVSCLTFVPDTDFLASGGYDGSILIFDLSTRKLNHSLPGEHSNCVASLLTVPGTTLLVSCSFDTTIKVWDIVTRTCVRTLTGHKHFVLTLANVPGNLVVSGSNDGSIMVWNPATGELVRTISGGEAFCVVYVPGLDLLASSSRVSITLWDLATGEKKAIITDAHTGDAHTGRYVSGLAVVPGTTLLASCSFDKTVKVWDVPTGKCVKTLTGHGDRVHDIAVDPANFSLLSVSADNSLKLWTDLAARSRHRYCVLACLSRLTAKLYAGEEYAAADEGEDGVSDVKGGGGGGKDGGGRGRLQGVLAFDCIASADLWRHILEFV